MAEVWLLLLAVVTDGLAIVLTLALSSVNLVTTSAMVGRFSGKAANISFIILLMAFSNGVSEALSMIGLNVVFLLSHNTFPRL